ncbi:hypothetical protein UMM65_02695 [Aureibaculum sp. 2210JD6-5]|uniref:hypothetical protein n=1 Tax=Aureibaculum sp. 2210JD6-5 TaxID=3103957 RepID=UPI002AAEADF1|nr:hypothetical protein [Aureibaculum sp. 2210JD6-5]MDY7394134.1 hypothetical protein [Aureibaculum sp. 2210JD6-5]
MKVKISILIFSVALLLFTSCDSTSENTDAPNLPPEGSMVMDFEDFNNTKTKSIADFNTKQADIGNWFYSAAVVGVWNTALFTTLAVPVASFRSAFAHQAVYLGNAKWQWSYTVDGFASQYSARLTGELTGNEVHWEMYVAKSGIGAFDEFMWFSGISNTDGKSGYWLLNHSAAFPENMLRIDWKVENDEIGNIKYTYVRDLNDQRNDDKFKGSYIVYGLQTGDYDAFYDVHAYDNDKSTFVDVDIEWNRTNNNGRVMASYYFGDDDWHCWNSKGEDEDCN